MTPRPGAARHGLFAGLAVAALAAFGPVIVMALNRASAAPDFALKPLDLSPTCVNEGSPSIPGPLPGRAIIQQMNCGGIPMAVQIEVFSPRSTAAPVYAERRRLTRLPEADDISEAPLTTGTGTPLRPWRVVRANEPAFVAEAGIWVNGEPMTPSLSMRLGMARSSVFGGAYAPVLVTIAPVADWHHIDTRQKQELERRVTAVVEAHPEIGDQVREIARAAR
jgi:hypothetical protein